ncbi:MAG: antitoxin VapB family protein [Candidatus Lokiarchaeota archaeon]|nr:antitoxin VapB family protein [Candidatus Lokiarchaeota archaeon]
MSKKTISLSEDLYLFLKKQKFKGESFSELIIRLLQEKQTRYKNLEKLAGCLKEDDEWDQILEDIYKDRKNEIINK